jgi:hypothetical protein
MDLEHLQELVSVEERNRCGAEASNTQRMSLPCKHRSRAVIKSASASGLSLMIPSGVIFFKLYQQHTLNADKSVLMGTALEVVC